MEHKKKFKKIGFIFGLKREMNLVSHKKKNIICVCGYGKGSKNATQELINFGVDIVINFGFAGSITKNLKNGDIVFIDKLFNEKKEKLSTLKFDKDLLRRLESSFKFFRGNLLTVNKIVADKKEKLNPGKTKISKTKESIKKEPKKGLFNRKSKPVEENLPVQKKGLFGRKKEVIKEEIKPKKKGWFK